MLEKAVLKSFDAVTCTATVQAVGAVSAHLRAVPVNRGIAAAEMVAGRYVAVAVFDPTNPSDAAVLAVWE